MSYDITKSIEAFQKSSRLIPGGVNSPVRAFKSVGGNPIFIKRGKGAKIYDIDDNEYIDYCMSWGALIMGHARMEVIESVKKAIENGSSFGCPTTLESELAQMIVDAYQSIEKVRFVNSGTEATMSAIRLARGYSGRDKIIKFDGCYHGHADQLLVASGSGVAEIENSTSKGVTKGAISDTISIPFNDIALFEEVIKNNHKEIACVIIEPVPANMGLVLPKPGFLEEIREITRKYEIILIFDEVISGFRVAYGGAQQLFNVIPDITCLGKIIGGGFPVGAFGGKAEIMNSLAPLGQVYQAGTLSGNPVAMAAGIETLKLISEKNFYYNLSSKMAGLKNMLSGKIRINSIGSIFWFYNAQYSAPENYKDILSMDTDYYKNLHRLLLKNGCYLPPSPLEVGFISDAHSFSDIEKLVDLAKNLSTI